ncbi:MAG: hypothetical protein ACYDCQ_19220 [Dehalococcoidia bacterium]
MHGRQLKGLRHLLVAGAFGLAVLAGGFGQSLLPSGMGHTVAVHADVSWCPGC